MLPNWLKKEIGIWMVAAGVCLCVLLAGRLSNAQGLQEGIAGEILRFHVLANSDSEEDQNLKLQVKDAVVGYMQGILQGTADLEETKERVENYMEDIQSLAKSVIREKGYAYPVEVALETCYFPIKTYGDCTFPAGEYEALRIRIGKAEGKNWWCVLFPNLCFVDSIHGIVPEEEKQELKNVLTENEYDSIFSWQKNPKKVAFKYLPF